MKKRAEQEAARVRLIEAERAAKNTTLEKVLQGNEERSVLLSETQAIKFEQTVAIIARMQRTRCRHGSLLFGYHPCDIYTTIYICDIYSIYRCILYISIYIQRCRYRYIERYRYIYLVLACHHLSVQLSHPPLDCQGIPFGGACGGAAGKERARPAPAAEERADCGRATLFVAAVFARAGANARGSRGTLCIIAIVPAFFSCFF